MGSMPSDEERVSREALMAMRKEFEVLEDMAETFSELGRMAEPLNRAPLQLNHLCRSVATLHAEGPVQIDVDLEDDLPLVDGDERSLRRVLSNLVKNAIEAQPNGGVILFRTHSNAASVYLEVRDEGPGIPEDVRARVFEAGFSTKSRGSGVGLFLARAVVERHGGRIEIESATGLGTVVRVEIPAARVDRTAA